MIILLGHEEENKHFIICLIHLSKKQKKYFVHFSSNREVYRYLSFLVYP